MDSLVLDTAIGLIFIFATFAMVVSLVTELITRFLGLRGEYLLRGIRSLTDLNNNFKFRFFVDTFRRTPGKPDAGSDPLATKLLETPYVKTAGDKGEMPPNAGNAALSGKQRRALPSYLSARTFARAVMDIAMPPKPGGSSFTDIETGIGNLTDGPLKTYLLAVIKTTGDDVEKIQKALEAWYDDHMARVSGWYKRHVRWISLALGLVLVVAFNINVVAISRALYSDQALRESVVTLALQQSDCAPSTTAVTTTVTAAIPPATPSPAEPTPTASASASATPSALTPGECLASVQQQVGTLRAAGLPIGWASQGDLKTCGPPPSTDQAASPSASPSPSPSPSASASASPSPSPSPSTSPNPADCTGAQANGFADPTDGSIQLSLILLVLLGWLGMVLVLLPGARFWFDLLGRLGSLRSTGPKPS